MEKKLKDKSKKDKDKMKKDKKQLKKVKKSLSVGPPAGGDVIAPPAPLQPVTPKMWVAAAMILTSDWAGGSDDTD